jgi:proteic killer suppression protein
VIRSFGNRLADDLFHDRLTTATRRFPPELRRAAQRKLQYLNAAVRLRDLAVPPGNRLEALKGDRRGFHSIRINDQWRIIFNWKDDGVTGVAVTDYH